MEKLIELLSKAKPLAPGFWWDIRNYGAMIISKEEKNNGHSGEICFVRKEELCGKEYGFIKWLVDNDKIDFIRLDDDSNWYDINTESEYLDILALLSIQDNPIEFLCEILK